MATIREGQLKRIRKDGYRRLKILVVFGTRPEIIKFSPVIHTLRPFFEVKVLFTGQHRELARDVMDFLNLEPDYEAADIMSGSLSSGLDLQDWICQGAKLVIAKENPDLIIVQGDTYSSFGAALAAFLLRKPLLHLEAGLRTYRKFAPYPEETLRCMISRLADFHFAPTPLAYRNLIREGIRQDRVMIVGNTIVDAHRMVTSLLDERVALEELVRSGFDLQSKQHGRQLITITCHRRENIGLPLQNVCRSLKKLAMEYQDCLFLWVLHRNPKVREIIFQEINEQQENLVLVESLSYPTMMFLLRLSLLILTDSGGLQEEAPSYNKPVLILRDSTERPEIIDCGLGFLVGSDQGRISTVFRLFYENKELYQKLQLVENPFGDGRTSERLLHFLLHEEIQDFLASFPSSSERILSPDLTTSLTRDFSPDLTTGLTRDFSPDLTNGLTRDLIA